MRLTPAVLLVAFAVVCNGATGAERVTKSVAVKRPMIVAFVPSEFEKSEDHGADEAAAHLRFAVEDTYKCLSPKKLDVTLLYADRITLKNGRSSETIPVHTLGQSVGALLVEPGRSATVVFSVEGPSTLTYLLPRAASKYWNAKACEQ